MPNNTREKRAIVIDGDVTRRIASVYVPDFYKENPVFTRSLEILKNSAHELQYIFEKINRIPDLVSIDNCPDSLLPHLASLLGYTWKPNQSVTRQRREISKLVQVYQIKGTPKSVIRIVYYAGAGIAEVMTPFEHLFRFNKSRLSSGDRFEDPEFWRWGTYEVAADIDFSLINSDIDSVHPGGMVWYGKQLIQLLNEDAHIDYELISNSEIDIIHTDNSNYLRRNAELYDDLVLDPAITPPVAYYKLDEGVDLGYTTLGEASLYSQAKYNSSQYGDNQLTGRIARDSSGNDIIAYYNSEYELLSDPDEAIIYTNAVDTVYGPAKLSGFPINPGSVKLSIKDVELLDNGKGVLVGPDGSYANINYDTGLITDISFSTPPGVWKERTLPILDRTTEELPDNITLWLKSDTDLTLQEDDKVASWVDQSSNNYDFTAVNYVNQPTYQADVLNSYPAIVFNGQSSVSLDTPVTLSDHTLFIVFKLSELPTGNSLLVGDNATGDSKLNVGIDEDLKYNCLSYYTGGDPAAVNFEISNDTWYILSVVRDSAADVPSFYINGTRLPDKTDVVYSTSNDFILGSLGALNSAGSGGFKGAITEVVGYSSVLSDADRVSVETYLAKKYLLPSGLCVWLDANTLTTTQFFWADSSGRGNNALQYSNRVKPGRRSVTTSNGTYQAAQFLKASKDYMWLRAATILDRSAHIIPSSGNRYRGRLENTTSEIIINEFSKFSDANHLPSGTGDYSISDLIIREDGVVYGTPHSSMSDIATIGLGKYLHSGTSIYFSSSDNSNPRTISSALYSVERPMPDLGVNHTIAIVFAIRSKNSTNGSIKHSLLSSFGTAKNWVYYEPDTDGDKIVYQLDSTHKWEAPLTYQLNTYQFYSLVIVREDGKATFYLDGQLLYQNTITGTSSLTTSFSRFGVEPNNGGTDSKAHHFNGYLAELNMYDRVLFENETADLSRYLATKWNTLKEPVRAFYNDYVERGVSGVLPSTVPERTGVRLGSRAKNNRGAVIINTTNSESLIRMGTGAFGAEAWLSAPLGSGGCWFGSSWTEGEINQFWSFKFLLSPITGKVKVTFNFPLDIFDGEVEGNTVIADGSWHHVFVALDPPNSRIQIYVDGLLDINTTVDFGTTNVQPSTEVLIGGVSTTGNEWFTGYMDEVAIYREDLPTEDTLLRHFLHGKDNIAVVKSTSTFITSRTDVFGPVGRPGFVLGVGKLGTDTVGQALLGPVAIDVSPSDPQLI